MKKLFILSLLACSIIQLRAMDEKTKLKPIYLGLNSTNNITNKSQDFCYKDIKNILTGKKSDILSDNLDILSDNLDYNKVLEEYIKNEKSNRGNSKLLKYIVDRTALDKKDDDGNTILYKAVYNAQVLKHILKNDRERKRHINIQNKRGDTVLHHAIRINCFNVIYILISYGADITITDRTGATPWQRVLRKVNGSYCSFDNQALIKLAKDIKCFAQN